MARKPQPVRPRRIDERRYEQILKSKVINPYMTRIVTRISEVDNFRALFTQIDEEYGKYLDLDLRDIPDEQARAHIEHLNAYHRAKIESTLRAAMGVNIGSVLQDVAIRTHITAAIDTNVGLIKSIPSKFHADLKEKLEQTLTEKGFDRQAINQTLQKRYKVTASRAKIISRDQTSKTIGSLTEARHKQVGIQRYEWATAGDERVRPVHSDLNGTKRSWDDSGIKPGEEILCRCVAIPVIE